MSTHSNRSRAAILALPLAAGALLIAASAVTGSKSSWEEAESLCGALRSQEIQCNKNGQVEIPSLTEARQDFVRAIAKIHPITLYIRDTGLYYRLVFEGGAVRIADKYYYKEGRTRSVPPCIAVDPGGSIFAEWGPYECEKEATIIKKVYYRDRGKLF